MKIEFEENEFTTQELLFYLQSAYVIQINGKAFMTSTIRNWIEIKHFPFAYGGHKITSNIIYPQYGNMRVLTVEGLLRKDVIEMVGELHGRLSSGSVAKNELPRKQRTKLYYDTLESAGKQYTKNMLAESALPLYWKEAGIKKNQLINEGKSIVKNRLS